MGDFNGHVGRNIDGFQGAHAGFSIGEINQERRMLLEICNARLLWITKKCIEKADLKKVTNGSGCTEIEIDLCIMGKVYCKFCKT